MLQALPADEQVKSSLARLKGTIEASLIRAGARMALASISVSHPGARDLSSAQRILISVTPQDAPKITVEFARREVIDGAATLAQGGVPEKIRLFEDRYKAFRASPERAGRWAKKVFYFPT